MSIFKKIDLYQEVISAERPFEEPILSQLRGYYRVGLTWSSNALEGNTLTESETKVLLEDGLTVGGKPLRDSLEAVGHAAAYDYMFTLLKEKQITEQDILSLHRLFYSSIETEYAGRYRDIPVFISGSQYPVTEVHEIGAEMRRLCGWMQKERCFLHPVEFAALLHRRFVSIHPFKDGNGRVARLLMNTALIQEGYLPVIIPPVLRLEYIATLEKARWDETGFVEFIIEREQESQKEMMRLLHIPIPKFQEPDLSI